MSGINIYLGEEDPQGSRERSDALPRLPKGNGKLPSPAPLLCRSMNGINFIRR